MDMTNKDVLVKLGKSILEYIEDNYPQGEIKLAIDPDIWEMCIRDAGVSIKDVNEALKDVPNLLNIFRLNPIEQQPVENQYIALAAASFQIKMTFEMDAWNDRRYNENLKEFLNIRNIYDDYYRKKDENGRSTFWSLTFQELIYYNVKDLLKKYEYIIDFGDEDSYKFVRFPRSQSLRCIVEGFSRKDARNKFAQKWAEDFEWRREDSLNEGFREIFYNRMKDLVQQEYGLYGKNASLKIDLVLGYLYGYFSNVWNGEYPDSETGRVENVQKNKYTIERLKIDGGRASFELWKNEEKINYIPKVVLYSKHKRNSVFLIDERYEGYASLERDEKKKKKCKEEKCIILASLNGLQNLPEHVEVYEVDGYCGYRLFFVDVINEEIVQFFNLKTETPFFEFIGGVCVNRDAQNSTWFDFAIPKLKINSSKDKLFVDSTDESFSIDGDELEKEIDLSNLERDVEYRFHLENARKSVKFKIVSADNYPKGEIPEDAGWVIGQNRIGVVQGPCKKNECRIKGLEGVNMDDDPCSPIMRHLKRFEFVKKTVENNQIEKRRKYVC